MFISFEFVNARSEPQQGLFCPFQLQLFARFIKSLNFYRKQQWNSLIMHNLQWTPAHNIVVTCVSICIQLYSLPKRWGRMCCVAQEDFPEGSRCSFIQLSNRVEQRKRNWKSRGRRVEGEKKKKRSCNTEWRRGCRRGGELDGCGGEEGSSFGLRAWHSRNAFPCNLCISKC